MQNNKKRAFTLIELLVVVAVIGVLIAILLPTLGKVRSRASTAKCMSTIRGLNNAMDFYVTQWNKAMPYIGNPAVRTAAWNNVLRTTLSSGYGITLKARICPEAVSSNQIDRVFGGEFVWFGAAKFAWGHSLQTGFEDDGVTPIIASYGINGFVYSGSDLTTGIFANSSGAQQHRIPLKSFASEVPYFVDATWRHIAPNMTDSWGANLQDPGTYDVINWPMSYALINRHNKAVNVGFADSHVETVKLQDMWKPRWSKNWVPRVAPGGMPSK